jgi:hypothetical protein
MYALLPANNLPSVNCGGPNGGAAPRTKRRIDRMLELITAVLAGFDLSAVGDVVEASPRIRF